jgi:hypothetical protein
MAWPQKQGAISGGEAAEMVRCGIASRVGLCLYDPSRNSASQQFAHNHFADQKSRQ